FGSKHHSGNDRGEFVTGSSRGCGHRLRGPASAEYRIIARAEGEQERRLGTVSISREPRNVLGVCEGRCLSAAAPSSLGSARALACSLRRLAAMLCEWKSSRWRGCHRQHARRVPPRFTRHATPGERKMRPASATRKRSRNQRASNPRQRKQQHLLDIKVRARKATQHRNRRVLVFVSKIALAAAVCSGSVFAARVAMRRFFFENPDYRVAMIDVQTDGSLLRDQVLKAADLREGENIFQV